MVLATHEMAFAREIATRSASSTAAGSSSRARPPQVLVDPREERTRQFLRRVL